MNNLIQLALTDAFNFLQDALAAAQACDEIRICGTQKIMVLITQAQDKLSKSNARIGHTVSSQKAKLDVV